MILIRRKVHATFAILFVSLERCITLQLTASGHRRLDSVLELSEIETLHPAMGVSFNLLDQLTFYGSYHHNK